MTSGPVCRSMAGIPSKQMHPLIACQSLSVQAVLPLGPDLEYSDEKPPDPMELRVYPGADGDFTVYEDEGDTYNYETGLYATIPIHWSDATRTLTIGDRAVKFPGMLGAFHVVLVSGKHGAGIDPTDNPDKIISYRGQAVSARLLMGIPAGYFVSFSFFLTATKRSG
jgi:hypothetical protein